MGLALRISSIVGAVLLRATLLVAALFLMHLVVSRALPELQAAMRAMERRPFIEQELKEVKSALEKDLAAASELERRIGQKSQSALLEVSSKLADWEQRLADLEAQRVDLVTQLEALKRERDEVCDSFNPIDWWVCRRLRESFDGVSARLTPLIAELEKNAAAARASIEELRADVGVLNDPNLRATEKLGRLGLDTGSTDALSLDVTKQRIEGARRGVTALERELERTLAVETSPAGFLLREWRSVRLTLIGIVILVMALPYLQRVLNYFVFMPLVTRFAAPLQLVPADGGTLRCGGSVRSLAIKLGAGEHASVRSEYARPVQGRVSGRLLYRLSAPFISYAAGLTLLTRVEGSKEAPVELTLAAPNDPNAYLMRVELEEHPGIVIHPKHLVGVIGDLDLSTRWRLFSIHAWATWQLRYILVSGTGSIIVEGSGDVIATAPGGTHPSKIEQKLVIGFDARLAYTTGRTEIFWPYLLGKTPLVDDVFRGPGRFFWQKSTLVQAKSPLARSFDVLFSAIGKLLGF
jgi:uncharacterized protein (AIM24 family)